MKRGVLLLVAHLALLGVLAGKAWWDRDHNPRLWVRTLPVDPDHPLRGRYVRLRIPVEATQTGRATLRIEDDRLVATLLPEGDWNGVFIQTPFPGSFQREAFISEPLAFYIPDNVPDPARRGLGEELWVEVTVTPRGLPRPVRLGVKKDGKLDPLVFR